ncbi:uncharacterized protein DS421_5g161930 [Arachis hypogaea]|nr:uncharacterized protein DS421_5g161930 [Arachis hypogaea]
MINTQNIIYAMPRQRLQPPPPAAIRPLLLAVESLFEHIAASPSHVGHLVGRLFGHLAVAHLYVLLLSVVVAVVDPTSVGHLTRVPLLATSRLVYFVSVAGSPPKLPFCSAPRVMSLFASWTSSTVSFSPLTLSFFPDFLYRRRGFFNYS